MKIRVPIETKKHFLQWFMNQHDINSNEINWFLEDLLSDERALSYLHFVHHIEDCPKGIIISTEEHDSEPFIFFKGAVKTNDVYTAYHELNLYAEEAFYIQVNFPHNLSHPLYNAVLEEEVMLQKSDKQHAEDLLTHLQIEGEEKRLRIEINKALDQLDYDKFALYTKELNEFLSYK